MGGILGGLLGLGGNAISSAMNMKIAQKQMDFQERMSNTAMQRSMADYRAAGLNPMFAARFGGASTPPGAAIPVNFDANSAMATGRAEALKKDEQDIKYQQSLQNQISTRKLDWEEKTAFEQMEQAKIGTKMAELALPEARAKAGMWEAVGSPGKAAQTVGTGFLTRGASKLFSSAKAVLRGTK